MNYKKNINLITTPTKLILIFVSSILLSLLLSPLGGRLHRLFWKSRGCDFWGPCDTLSRTEGFIYFYIFFIVFFSFSLLNKKIARLFFIISTFFLWVIIIFKILIEDLKFERSESIGTFIIMLISFALGYGISFLIKRLKLKKKKTD